MKTSKFFLFQFLIITVLFSCSKSFNGKDTVVNSPDESIKNSLSESIWKAVNSPSIMGIRQSYHLLNTNEKQLLWETKLNAILKNDEAKLNVTQKEIVNTFLNIAQKDNFERLIANPSIGEELISKNFNNYNKYFSSEQLFFLFECAYYENGFSIFKTSEYLNKLTQPSSVDPPVSNCTCYYSLYCETTPSEPGNTCVSKNNPCKPVAECGVFGTSNCTGTCQ